MRIHQITLDQFRNYPQLSLDFHPDTNLIYGENAQGKTNLLEAITLLSRGKSFRTTKDQEMILLGHDQGKVNGFVHSCQRDYGLSITLRRGQKKRFVKNDLPCPNTQDFHLHTVLFCPEDLSLVKEGAKGRRGFLDNAISQLRPSYASALRTFKRVYGHKSEILRHQSPNMMNTLPDFNYQLAQASALLIHYRAHYIKRLAEVIPPIHHEFSGNQEELSLRYQTVSTVSDPLAGERRILEEVMAHQDSHYSAEIASGRCLTGAHKDELWFGINGLCVKDFGSQGQCRTLALSLKLGERELVFQETGMYPILLLDDVLSELDLRRQEFVLNRIRHGQTFITCCHKEGFHGLKDGGLFGISQGKLIKT